MDTHRRYTYILLDAVALRIKIPYSRSQTPFSYVRIFFVCQPSNNTRVRSFRPYLLFGVIAWVFHAVFCWLQRRVVVAFARWGTRIGIFYQGEKENFPTRGWKEAVPFKVQTSQAKPVGFRTAQKLTIRVFSHAGDVWYCNRFNYKGVFITRGYQLSPLQIMPAKLPRRH